MEADQRAPSREGTLVDGRYRMLRPIGVGGMGEVWEAMHEGIGRKVALKVLHKQYARDAEVVARFHREARTASLIGDPRIVDVLDMGMLADGAPYLVMELLHGETLADLLLREGKLPVQKAAQLAIEMAHALGAAHDKGIVHRDLKPDNVFLVGPRASSARTSTSRIKLLDFGIAKMRAASEHPGAPGVADGLTQTGTAVGTPTYMSPEQASGYADVDGGTDMWSLGVLLYRMLAGTTPFVAEGYALLLVAILSRPHTPITEHRSDLPPELILLIDRLLAKERSARPASMLAIAEALEPFAASLDSSAGHSLPIGMASAETSAASLGSRATEHAVEAPSRPRVATSSMGLPAPEHDRSEPERTVRTPVSSAQLRAFAASAAAGMKRSFSPEATTTIALEHLLFGVPAHATVKGMYLTQILSRHSDRAQVLDAAGVVAGRWVPFSDVPFTDWARLVHASARLRWPGTGSPTARSLRTVTQDVFGTFADSLAGRVSFGPLGRDFGRVLGALPRFDVTIKPLTIESVAKPQNVHQLVFSGFGPLVVEGLFLGIVEGAAQHCGVTPRFVLETDGSMSTTVEVSW